MDQEKTRAVIYALIQKALLQAARNQPSARVTEQILSTVGTAFNDACADVAETWNSRSAGAIAQRFPAEILAMCFRNAPFVARVQASHVSRKWRTIALSDRSLWATFRRSQALEHWQADRLLNQLSVMLERSRPLPFTLHLPSSFFGSRSMGIIIALLESDFQRLQDFVGPIHLFQQLNPSGVPMPFLDSLRLISESDTYSYTLSTFEGTLGWARRGAPGLRRLELRGQKLVIAPTCSPLASLTHICFWAGGEHTHLFRWCPNLVSLELCDVLEDSALPAAPLPHSLSFVSLRADRRAIEFGTPLAAWADYRIPQLVVYNAASLAQPLDIFLSLFKGPLRVEIARHLVEIAGCAPLDPNCHANGHYVVHPCSWDETNHLLALRGGCAARLTSVSVQLDHFGLFFAAQLDTPVLLSLAFYIAAGSLHVCIPPLPAPAYCLVAPQLRDMTLWLPLNIPNTPKNAMSARAVDALRFHLRDLIAYNRPLLNAITVRGGRAIMSRLGCTDLAQYAQSYVEVIIQWTVVRNHMPDNDWLE